MNDDDFMMNPMAGGNNPQAEYGINPLVAAMLSGGGGAAGRSDADWDMIRKELERMQKVNKKLHGEVKELKKEIEFLETSSKPAKHVKVKKKGRKKKEFGGGTIGREGSVHSREDKKKAVELMNRMGGKHGSAKHKSHADHHRLGDARDALVMGNPMAAAQPAQTRTGSLTKKGDWIEATDPGSGRQYWHNAVTGESTWVDPHAV